MFYTATSTPQIIHSQNRRITVCFLYYGMMADYTGQDLMLSRKVWLFVWHRALPCITWSVTHTSHLLTGLNVA